MEAFVGVETIAQAAVFPPQAWVLKRELMWIPLVGWAVKCLKPIAINRKAGAAAVTQVVEQGKARLQEGLWVLIFPEGTRVAVGETRKYGVSGSLLASRAGCKIIPVAHNAGYFWPRRGWVKKPGTIRVVIGPPIDAAGRDARELNEGSASLDREKARDADADRRGWRVGRRRVARSKRADR